MSAELLQEVIEDFDLEVRRMVAAGTDLREQRRAMRAAIGLLYLLRENRIDQEASKKAYFQLVRSAEGGRPDSDARVAEGVIFIRGALAHNLTHDRLPAGQAYLDAYLDSEITANTLVWRPKADMSDQMSAAVRRPSDEERLEYYEAGVAGQSVVTTLAVARRVFVGAPEAPPPTT